MRKSIIASALLVALAGCGAIPKPGLPGQEEPQESPPPASSLAGTWTRQGESPRVFDVTDDGTTVHGELRDAKAAGFDSYTFDLKRKGASGLEGKARFVLTDTDGKAFEAAWDAKVDGTVITCKQEDFGLSDTNEIIDRSTITHTYDVAMAAAAAPAMPEMDMSAYVPVSPTYKHLLAEDLAVGQWVDVEMEAAGQKFVTRTAVVGDAGDAWILELDNQMNQKDLLLAVFVDKETGATKKAFVGKRGKEGKPKDVPPMTDTPTGPTPEPSEEEVTVPAGTFAAHRIDTDVQGSTYSTWVGKPGTEAEGVLLKSANPQGQDELQELESVNYDASGTSFDARRLVYTSGMELVMATGEKKPHLNMAMLLTKTSASRMALAAQGDDAKAELTLP